jgi:hypothetical protein
VPKTARSENSDSLYHCLTVYIMYHDILESCFQPLLCHHSTFLTIYCTRSMTAIVYLSSAGIITAIRWLMAIRYLETVSAQDGDVDSINLIVLAVRRASPLTSKPR